MGFTKFKFHAVFTDHKVSIQKHQCKNPECGWQSTPTSTSVFGTSTHPDLAKIQSEQGILHRFRKAQSSLEALTVHARPVNNHNKIKLITDQLGAQLAKANLKSPSKNECASPAQEVIVQIDGGHIPIKDKDKRSFETLSAVAYRAENIQTIDQHHRKIMDKSCALSVLVSLGPHCKKLICILDWFYIAMTFQNVRGAVDEAFEESLKSVKWTLWHGKSKEALSKLTLLVNDVIDSKQRKKLID